MKVFSKLRKNAGTFQELVDSIEIKLGLVWYNLKDIYALRDSGTFAVDGADVNMWLSIGDDVQGIRYNDGASVVEASFQSLGGEGDKFFSLSKSKLLTPMFEAGKIYLIPYTADAVTDVVPPVEQDCFVNAPDAVFLSNAWAFRASQDADLRNGQTFEAYTVVLHPKGIDKAVIQKIEKRNVEAKNFVESINIA
jgi:hypothetical protein